MQIQWWEGAASSCAEAVLQSATRDSMSREAGCLRKRIVKSVVEELEKEIRSKSACRKRSPQLASILCGTSNLELTIMPGRDHE